MRTRSLGGPEYEQQCERWLDHWHRGLAQRERLKRTLAARGGTESDPKTEGSNFAGDGDSTHLTEEGQAVLAGTTELVTCGYAKRIAQDLGVLYASDDLERLYASPDGSLDKATTETLEWYHDPDQGCLDAVLHLVDAHLVGLRMMGLLVSWSPELEHIVYELLFPHMLAVLPHHRYSTKLRLAQAIGYRESTVVERDGTEQPEDVWCVYVRPPLESDPPDSPCWEAGPKGRMVRYSRGSRAAVGHPWPVPAPGDECILEGWDRPNPIVEMGGDSKLWCPIVVHYAEIPVGHWRLPVADHLARMNEELDAGFTDVHHEAALQSHGQPVYTGHGDPPDVLGPSHVVHVQDPQGDFKYVATNGKPTEHLEALRKSMQLQGILEGVPSDTFLDKPPSIETGPAKQLRRSGLVQERSSRTIMGDRAEARLFALDRLLHNANGVTDARPTIPVDTTMAVHWGELITPTAWTERLDEMAREKSLGLTSQTDMIRERHGVSRTEAERRAAELKTTTLSKPAALDLPIGGEGAPRPGKGDGDEGINGN